MRIGHEIQDGDSWTQVLGVIDIDGAEVRKMGNLGSAANWVLSEKGWRRAIESPLWQAASPVKKLVSFITTSGSFSVNTIQMRDFTDVGIDNIYKTYPFTLSRL